MKLYELNECWNNIFSLIEEAETEEEKETLQKSLDNIDEAIEEKANNIAKVLKSLEANVEALKAEEQRLSARRKSLENNSANLKSYLEMTMLSQDKKKIKTDLFSFNIQKNAASLNVLDASNIPETFFIEQEAKLDKKSLLKAIKEGLTIEGVELKQSESLRIR